MQKRFSGFFCPFNFMWMTSQKTKKQKSICLGGKTQTQPGICAFSQKVIIHAAHHYRSFAENWSIGSLRSMEASAAAAACAACGHRIIRRAGMKDGRVLLAWSALITDMKTHNLSTWAGDEKKVHQDIRDQQPLDFSSFLSSSLLNIISHEYSLLRPFLKSFTAKANDSQSFWTQASN